MTHNTDRRTGEWSTGQVAHSSRHRTKKARGCITATSTYRAYIVACGISYTSANSAISAHDPVWRGTGSPTTDRTAPELNGITAVSPDDPGAELIGNYS